MSGEQPASLSLRGLTVALGGERLLDQIDLEVLPGELVVVLGAAGAGKTCLLRAISGLDPVTGGSILVDGRDLTHRPVHDRDMVLLQPGYPLWPGHTVIRNVTLALRYRGIDRKTRRARAAEMLGMLGLEEFGRHLPGQLTPSQRQRVALARSLASEAAVTLLDEPFSAQGAQTREPVMAAVRHHLEHRPATALIATEEPGWALRLADRIALLVDGRLVQCDTPQALYDAPATRQVATQLGRANLLAGEVEYAGGQAFFRATNGVVMPLFDHKLKRARRGWAMFRPHQLRPIDAEALSFGERIRISGLVTRVEFGGDVVHYSVDVAGTTLWGSQARGSGHPTPTVGEQLTLGIDPAQIRVLEQ